MECGPRGDRQIYLREALQIEVSCLEIRFVWLLKISREDKRDRRQTFTSPAQ